MLYVQVSEWKISRVSDIDFICQAKTVLRDDTKNKRQSRVGMARIETRR